MTGLIERGRLHFFYHSPSSELPIRDVLNEQKKGFKKEPFLEKSAENYCVRCYQTNISGLLKKREKYLFLFTTCRSPGRYRGQRFIVGYLKVEKFKLRWTSDEHGGRKCHWAVIGPIRLVGFKDAYPLETLVGPQTFRNIRMRLVNEAETRALLDYFQQKKNIFATCLQEIVRVKKFLPAAEGKCRSSSCV